MNTSQAKDKIEQAGKTWEGFQEWMFGQTYGINKDGSPNWYETDVSRFIGV